MESLNKQIEMQDKFNLQIKLADLEKERSEIEAKISNVKRILYGNSPDSETGAGRKSKKSNGQNNASGLSGD